MSDFTYDVYEHYGTAAERAAFTPDPPVGIQPIYIWYETDTGKTYLYDTSWHLLSSGTLGEELVRLAFTIDGGGSAVSSTGIQKYFSIPITGVITKVRVLADQPGDIIYDLWNDSWANRPPTVVDSITASAKPTLSSAQFFEDNTLSGWSTGVTVGDLMAVAIDSVGTLTWSVLEIFIAPS